MYPMCSFFQSVDIYISHTLMIVKCKKWQTRMNKKLQLVLYDVHAIRQNYVLQVLTWPPKVLHIP
jgi:hypothetical protein